MLIKVPALLLRYREIVSYGFFGVLTTIVNVVSYIFFERAFIGRYANIAAVSVAWMISVLFAYFTNRRWVFQSRAAGLAPVLKEGAAFFTSRIFSGVIDLAIMYIAVDLMRYDGKIVKLLSNILVIIINYLLSKFFIFKPDFQKQKQAKEK